MSQPNSGLNAAAREGWGAGNTASRNRSLMVLAIDDDPGILGFYQSVMTSMGVRFEGSTDPERALDLVAVHNPSLVILDLIMPTTRGMELFRRIRSRAPQTRVAIITGNYTIETAVKAVQEGAIEYICKPVTAEKLRELVTRVRSLETQAERTRTREQELAEVHSLEGIISRSPRMLEVFDTIQRVAPHFRTALIVGERGSGRRAVARALHNLSPGKGKPLVIFKSEALSVSPVRIQAPEQWGDVFTGAMGGEGEISQLPTGGTVLVHEVGDLIGATQLGLLRLLDQVSARGPAPLPTPPWELRVIASTRHDLFAETQSGRFRADLWYRLNMVQIHVPALRERADDILLLARHFLSQLSAQYGMAIRRMSPGAEAALLAYSWPGNVAELENAMGRACMLAQGNFLDRGDLPVEVASPS